MIDYKCHICGKDARFIGANHFLDEENRVVCSNCGAQDNSKELPSLNQDELVHNNQVPDQHQHQIQVDLTTFMKAIPEIAQERVKQIARYGYHASHDAHHSLGDFTVFIERYLNIMKHHLCSKNPQEVANARKDLVKIAALSIAYLESHPLPSYE